MTNSSAKGNPGPSAARRFLRTLATMAKHPPITDWGLRGLEPFRAGGTVILYLHRFATEPGQTDRHDPGVLRAQLAWLRRRRFHLACLTEVLAAMASGRPMPRRSVVFTVDDGYDDFAAVAAPVFAAFDCPVTVFLVTDFVSGRLWNWWDRVEHILDRPMTPGRLAHAASDHPELGQTCPPPRDQLVEQVVERLKTLPDPERCAAIDRLARDLEVDCPTAAPERYRAMTWDQVRACAADGVTFAPHTVSHPILARVDAARAEAEIGQSWRQVQSSVRTAIPVFCYPNGKPTDFLARDKTLVALAGMRAALTACEGYLRRTAKAWRAVDPYAIPRFGCPTSLEHFMRVAAGWGRSEASSAYASR